MSHLAYIASAPPSGSSRTLQLQLWTEAVAAARAKSPNSSLRTEPHPFGHRGEGRGMPPSHGCFPKPPRVAACPEKHEEWGEFTMAEHVLRDHVMTQIAARASGAPSREPLHSAIATSAL